MVSTTLFTHRMCPFAQRAHIALNFVIGSSNFQIEEIDLYGNKPSWFVKMNPAGQVPVLKHVDVNGKTDIVTESEDILDYLSILDTNQGLLNPTTGHESYTADRDWYKYMISALLREGRSTYPQGSAKLKGLLGEIESKKASENHEGNFLLTGNVPSACDCSFFPMLYRIEKDFQGDLLQDFSELSAYLERMKSVPEVRETIVSSYWMWW